MDGYFTCVLCNSLRSKDGNSIPHTDDAKLKHARIHFMQLKVFDDGITEDEILQRCFVTRQPKVELSALFQDECRQSLRDLCKSLLEHGSKDTTTDCNLCGSAISIKATKHARFDHACAHLDVRLFQCRHCECASSSYSGILQHIRRVHNIKKPTNEDFEDKTVERFEEITDQINCCYSTSYPRAAGRQRQFVLNGKAARAKTQRLIAHLCYSIFIQRLKPSSIECNSCGLRITVRQPNHGFNARAMYKHAAAHLEVKLFTCLHCNQSMSSIRATRKHLSKFHQITGGNSGDFDDHSEKFHSEHLNMIERCFSAGHVKLQGPSFRDTTIRAEASIRSNATGSKLAVERQVVFNRLIRKRVDSDGKVKCSVCSKRIVGKVTRGFAQYGISHAEMHLQKPLYRCKLCQASFSTRPTVADHLRRKHALGIEKNHECFADQFHDEIMTMLTKCYAPEGS